MIDKFFIALGVFDALAIITYIWLFFFIRKKIKQKKDLLERKTEGGGE